MTVIGYVASLHGRSGPLDSRGGVGRRRLRHDRGREAERDDHARSRGVADHPRFPALWRRSDGDPDRSARPKHRRPSGHRADRESAGSRLEGNQPIDTSTAAGECSGRMEVPDGVLDKTLALIRRRQKELESITKRIERPATAERKLWLNKAGGGFFVST